MNNLQNNCETLVKENDLNIYATLSIFASKTPKLIECIFDAIKTENLTELEEFAAKLIVYSDNARLTGFTERVKNLIIAAREHKTDIAEKQIHSLKQCFEQMTSSASSAADEEPFERLTA